MPHVSNSQLKTHAACPRKWYLEKVEGKTRPPTPAQLKGIAAHTYLEDFLRHGKAVPNDAAGRLTCAIIPLVPRNVQPEVEFKLPFLPAADQRPAYNIVGAIDVVDPLAGVLSDMKTTSNIGRYALDEGELAADSQCNLYLWASHEDPGLPACNTFELLYVQTAGSPKTLRVRVTLTTDEIYKNVAMLKSRAEALAEHSQKTRPDVPANTNSCDAYGGCPHRATCLIDGVFSSKNEKERESEMSNFLEMLRKKREEALEPSVDPTPEPPEPEPMPPVEELASGPINPPDGIEDKTVIEPPTKKRGRPSKWPDVPAAFADPADTGGLGRMKKKDMICLFGELKNAVMDNGDVQALYSHLDYSVDKKTPAGELRTRLKAFIEAVPASLKPARDEQGNPINIVGLPEPDEVPLVCPVTGGPAWPSLLHEPEQMHCDNKRGFERAVAFNEGLLPVDAVAQVEPKAPEAQAPAEINDAVAQVEPKAPEAQAPEAQAPDAERLASTSTHGLVSVQETPDDDPEPEPWESRAGRILYVGCRPRATAPTHLDAVLQKLREQLTRHRGRHWLCIADYGVTGSKLIAEALAQIDPDELPPEIYADQSIPGHGEAIAVLATTYNVIERG